MQSDHNQTTIDLLGEQRVVVLFDGYCNFCSSTINFLSKIDTQKALFFATSQSNTGKSLAAKYKLGRIDSVVVITDQRVYVYSSAIIAISKLLPYPWKMFKFSQIAPRFFRDAIYKVIAKNRYKWFGKRATCRIPTNAERERFLD